MARRLCSIPETTTSTTVIACHHATCCAFGERKHQSHCKTAADNTNDISVSNNEEIVRLLKKLLDLNSRGTKYPTPTGQEEPSAENTAAAPRLEGDGSEQTEQAPDINPTGASPTYHEPGGAARMGMRTRGAVAPVSHQGLHSHQTARTR